MLPYTEYDKGVDNNFKVCSRKSSIVTLSEAEEIYSRIASNHWCFRPMLSQSSSADMRFFKAHVCLDENLVIVKVHHHHHQSKVIWSAINAEDVRMHLAISSKLMFFDSRFISSDDLSWFLARWNSTAPMYLDVEEKFLISTCIMRETCNIGKYHNCREEC